MLWVLLGGREFTWRVVYDRTWSVAVELSLAGVPMGEAVVDGVSHLFAGHVEWITHEETVVNTVTAAARK